MRMPDDGALTNHNKHTQKNAPGDLELVRRLGSGGSEKPRLSPGSGADRRSAAEEPAMKKLEAKGFAVGGAASLLQEQASGKKQAACGVSETRVAS
jgi:hypothetical protein